MKNPDYIYDKKLLQSVLKGLLACRQRDERNAILDELIDKVKTCRMTKEVMEQAITWINHTQELLEKEIDQALDATQQQGDRYQQASEQLNQQLRDYELALQQNS